MSTWRARLLMWCLITGIGTAHANATASLANTPEAMLVYHGSAALLDWFLLMATPAVLSGRLCDHMQWLCFASIMSNATGWLLYIAYVSPVYYNAAILALNILQWLRLIYPDNHADNPWLDLVCHRDRIGGKRNS